MVVMTHYNSSGQPHQDVGFAGMPMSLASLELEATEMAQRPFGALQNAVCALSRVCFCVCLYACVYQASGA